MKVPSFFNNKIVQYVFLALAVMNILGYLSTGAYECLLVFAVGYALTDNYCRNRSCSILGALFAANFVWGCGRVKETFVETLFQRFINDKCAWTFGSYYQSILSNYNGYTTNKYNNELQINDYLLKKNIKYLLENKGYIDKIVFKVRSYSREIEKKKLQLCY